MKNYNTLVVSLLCALISACGSGERPTLGTVENPVFEADFDWEPYISADGAFSVEFPVAPHSEQRSAQGQAYEYLTVYYTLGSGESGGLLRITYVDFAPEDVAGTTPAENYDAIAAQLEGQFSVISNESAQLNGYEIRKLVYGEPAQQSYAILVGNRLYMNHAGVDAISQRFLDSFEVR